MIQTKTANIELDVFKKKKFREIANAMEFTGKETVFQIGCRTGESTEAFAEKVKEILAVDPSEERIERCRQLGIPNAGFRAGDWQEETDRFDVVVARHFHSYEDIQHMCRIAKKRVCVFTHTDYTGEQLLLQHLLPEQSHSGLALCTRGSIFENYSHLFHMLYDFGIDPNIKIIKTEIGAEFPSAKAAENILENLFVLPDAEKGYFHCRLKEMLTESPRGVTLSIPIKTALLFWDTEDLKDNI